MAATDMGTWEITNPKKVRHIAAITPTVLRKATQKNPVAIQIIGEAQQKLALIVKILAKRLEFEKVPLSTAGSVLQSPSFRKGFLKALRPAEK